MKLLQSRLLLLSFCAAFALGTTVPVFADPAWKVDGKLIGKPRDNPQKRKKAKDVSGIACIAETSLPRLCVVADDEVEHAQVLLLEEGMLRAGDCIALAGDCKDTDVTEIDAEGVAFVDDTFYVIGSHGWPRHKDGRSAAEIAARLAAASGVYTIEIPDGVNKKGKLKGEATVRRSDALAVAIRKTPRLGEHYDRAIEDDGISVEAIAAKGEHLFVGFRTPVFNDGAPLLTVPRAVLSEDAPGPGDLIALDLGTYSLDRPRGIRDLAVVGDTLMVLSGPADDPDRIEAAAGDYSIDALDLDGAGRPAPASLRHLFDLPAYGDTRKPEAVLYLPPQRVRLPALVFSDGSRRASRRPSRSRGAATEAAAPKPRSGVAQLAFGREPLLAQIAQVRKARVDGVGAGDQPLADAGALGGGGVDRLQRVAV